MPTEAILCQNGIEAVVILDSGTGEFVPVTADDMAAGLARWLPLDVRDQIMPLRRRLKVETDLSDEDRAVIESEVAALMAQTIDISLRPYGPNLDEVRNEARRRIEARFPEWRQSNLNSRATRLLAKRLAGVVLSDAEGTEFAQIEAVWDWIAAVRAASNSMEVEPPADFRDDRHWPS